MEKRFRLAHVGLNPTKDWSAGKILEAFLPWVEMPAVKGEGNIFLGTEIEIMETAGPGRFGHLAFACKDLKGTILELEQKGITFDRSHFKYHVDGSVAAAYFKEEIGGFAVHLIQEKKEL